jgi:hypothetical protein
MMRVMHGCGLMDDECFDFVYKNTQPGSALRKFIVDLACLLGTIQRDILRHIRSSQSDILAEIAKNFHKTTSDNRRFKDETLQKVVSDNDQPKDEPTISIHA